MDSNGGYVVAGYATTAGVLAVYVAWLRVRMRRAQRSVPETGRPHA